ncbi:uncharacterized protein LOC111711750 isoform X2 [Eurytemora carolleeae]|uniref:uncharacterized protein LOC111711750 isoform X2 n=1 Tax=Eurytemora carolleeae TaxID=1294199 RepID=UPI000C78C80F|nr:uncharacterized protein LOC111711750 isoform X2 [Eurytemora carolleeae]|eukprot:XP_023341944.1 uncharacterized protein LOC111711750 isoform X2 [Eurytemora affinis]
MFSLIPEYQGSVSNCSTIFSLIPEYQESVFNYSSIFSLIPEYQGSVSNYSSIFSANAGGLVSSGINQISNTLGRKKRQAVTPAPVTTTMNPETEYYCLKHVILGTNTRSCAPKSFLNLTSPLCKTATIGDVCACNNVDFCNTGAMPMAGLLLILACLAIFA